MSTYWLFSVEWDQIKSKSVVPKRDTGLLIMLRTLDPTGSSLQRDRSYKIANMWKKRHNSKTDTLSSSIPQQYDLSEDLLDYILNNDQINNSNSRVHLRDLTSITCNKRPWNEILLAQIVDSEI
jgi:hypothetical protein